LDAMSGHAPDCSRSGAVADGGGKETTLRSGHRLLGTPRRKTPGSNPCNDSADETKAGNQEESANQVRIVQRALRG
jgi:hypothetical protein